MSKAIVRTTPTPSRSFARKVVRRAGPMERFFFTNSTLVTNGTIPGTYANGLVRQSTNTFTIFSPSDYSQGVSGREPVFIKRLDVVLSLQAVQGTTSVPFTVFGLGCLLLGTQDDIVNDVTGPDVFPFGNQGNVTGFQDLNPKVVRFASRRRWTWETPPANTFSGTDTDANLSAIVFRQAPKARVMKFTLRNKWLKEPEQVTLLMAHIKYAYDGVANVNTSGSIVGHHETYCSYRRY